MGIYLNGEIVSPFLLGNSSSSGKDGKSINWRGEYSESTQYSRLDAVSYDGSSYIFANDVPTTGAVPGIDAEWEIMAKEGDSGADGITPTIGENGNWYLGDTDTGKPSRGEKGEPGEGGSGSSAPTIYYDETITEELAAIVVDGFSAYNLNVLIYLATPSGATIHLYPNHSLGKNYFVGFQPSSTTGAMFELSSVKEGFLKFRTSLSPWGHVGTYNNTTTTAFTGDVAGVGWFGGPITDVELRLNYGQINFPAGTRVVIWKE